MVSVLVGFNLTTMKHVIQRLKTLLANYIGDIFQFYKNNGYTIKMLLMNREFECIRESLSEEDNINTTMANEHEREI